VAVSWVTEDELLPRRGAMFLVYFTRKSANTVSWGIFSTELFSTMTFAFEYVHCDRALASTFQYKELIFLEDAHKTCVYKR
jgi:hypothetical protein